MKNSTARQLINATAAAAGKQRGWVVMSKFQRDVELNTSAPMTYREAKAAARSIREACGYANVERA